MQEIAIKYIINILRGSHHLKEYRGRYGTSLSLFLLSPLVHKNRWFLVLNLKKLSFTFFNHVWCNHQVLDETYLTLKIRIWLNDNVVFLVHYLSDLIKLFPVDKQWIWSCIEYHLIWLIWTMSDKKVLFYSPIIWISIIRTSWPNKLTFIPEVSFQSINLN